MDEAVTFVVPAQLGVRAQAIEAQQLAPRLAHALRSPVQQLRPKPSELTADRDRVHVAGDRRLLAPEQWIAPQQRKGRDCLAVDPSDVELSSLHKALHSFPRKRIGPLFDSPREKPPRRLRENAHDFVDVGLTSLDNLEAVDH